MNVNINDTKAQEIYKNFNYDAVKNVQYAPTSTANTLKTDTVELSTKNNDKKKNIKKYIIAGLAAVGVIATAILCSQKGKTAKLQNFDFKNIPENFTGKVKGKLKGGDKLVMEYENGVLISSARSGKKNVSKVFETVNNEKIVKKTVNGKTSTINLTQAKEAIEKEQAQLKELLDKNDGLSSIEFSEKIQNIKHKTEKQQETIDKIISDKKVAEAKLAEYNRKNKDISEITFKEGTAYLKSNPKCKFFGTVHATLPNGDKVTMEYDTFGQLKKAQRSGKVNYTKEYSGQIESDKKVKITKDGKSEEINLYQKGQNKVSQIKEEKLKAPLNEALKRFKEAPEGTKEKLEAKIKYLEAQKNYYNKIGIYYENDNIDKEIALCKKSLSYYSTTVLDLSKTKAPEKSETRFFGPSYFNIKDEEQELYSQYNKKSADYAFLAENKDLTLDSKVDLFDGFDKKPYDIAERYAIMADNSIRQKGNAYVLESVPEVFEGVKQEDIFENLSKFARSEKGTKYTDFEIGGKKFHATHVGGGQVGSVYKIEDETGHKIAMKIFGGRGTKLDMNCGLSEIATSRKLTQDKVADVPQFFMANAGLYKLDKQGVVYDDTPWMLCEFIDETKKPKEGALKVKDWLSQRNMFYADGFKNDREHGYIVDVGGMVSNNYKDRATWGINGFDNNNGYGLSDLLEKALKSGHGVQDILKIFH